MYRVISQFIGITWDFVARPVKVGWGEVDILLKYFVSPVQNSFHQFCAGKIEKRKANI